jgi:hypothetical protein
MALDLNELEEEEREDWRTSSLVARVALRMSKRRGDRGGAAAAGLAENPRPCRRAVAQHVLQAAVHCRANNSACLVASSWKALFVLL